MLTDAGERASRPIWREALPESAPTAGPGEAGGLDADLVVVGCGLTGLSAAYHALVARPGLRVVVLEARRIGHGASSRSTGMLTPGIGQDLGKLVRKYGAEAARAMYRCSLRAVEYVGELAGREGLDIGLRMSGQLVVAHGPSGRRRLARQAGQMESLGLPCERLGDEGLSERLRVALEAPGGASDGPAALRLPVAGTLHPGRLVAELARAVASRGGRIVEEAEVVSLSRSAPVLVRLADGREIRAGHVVVASSGYAGPLDPQRGRLLPLHLRVLLTEPLAPAELAGLGWPGREGVIDSRRVFNYFRLTDDDRLLFGGGRPRYVRGGGQTELPAEGPDLDRLASAFRRRFPTLCDLPIARSWTGSIGYTLDTLPVIGPVAGHERVIFAGGWCGHGIALGVYSGRWVQQLIHPEAELEPFPWFRPRAPLAPPEPLLRLAAGLGTRALELVDRL